MPAPTSPPPTQDTTGRQRASYANPGMRISDAERSQVADRLSKHYGDGRLDQEEFSKRLDQAMGAVTQSDLAGLFADLPDDDLADGGLANGGLPGHGQPDTKAGDTTPPGTVPPGRGQRRPSGPLRPRRRPHRVLALVALIVVAAIVGHALSHLFIPWVVIAVVLVLWLRQGTGRSRRSPDR